MKRALTALNVLSLTCALGLGAAEPSAPEAAFRVHGRLSAYNGNPGFRIWIVGTKRILGVAEAPAETPLMPEKLVELARVENFVFGDFTVVPLTKDEPGVMRRVRVIRAEHLVVTTSDLQVIRKIDAPIKQGAGTSHQLSREIW